jgi:hypothetical protein
MRWNDQLRLVFSDVDETIADLYLPAEPAMLAALTGLLERGLRLVLITGQSVDNVEQRVVMRLPSALRHRLAVGACSGAELWGYSSAGERRSVPFDTAESMLSSEHKRVWRDIIRQLLDEFGLAPYPSMPIAEFTRLHREPWDVIMEDRGPQITFEFPNAFELEEPARKRLCEHLGFNLAEADFRIPVWRRARQLLEARSLPVTQRLAGAFALDFAIEGVTKSRAVEAALSSEVFAALGVENGMPRADEMEVWGDRFAREKGTDWLMCVPLDRSVRAISFRDEERSEFPESYNIQLWDGRSRLHAGLLEFLGQPS